MLTISILIAAILIIALFTVAFVKGSCKVEIVTGPNTKVKDNRKVILECLEEML